MSIVFIPKVAFHFGSGRSAPKVKTVPREAKLWLTKELNSLVSLRALSVTYKECAIIIGHSESSCASAIANHDLYAAVRNKRAALIAEARIL